MPRLRFLKSARINLGEITKYIARQSGSAVVARRFVGELEAQCLKLSQLPGTFGRARPELRADLRSVPFGNYIILFRYRGELFEVINVIEGHRDIAAHVAPPDGT